jgi:tetratricopeptide (TPR) repeat protein
MKTCRMRSTLIVALSFTFMNVFAQRFDSISSYIQHYEYQKAIDQIGKVDDSDLALVKWKATALKGLNRYQEAIPYQEIVFKNDTTDLRNAVELANCYQSLGDYKNAQKIYRKVLPGNEQNNYLIQQLADSYYLDEDFANAIITYLMAYKSDSSYYLTRQLAMSYDNSDKADTAIVYYKKAIQLNPIDFQSTSRLANIYKQKKDYKTGIALTDLFLKYDSTNVKMLKTNGFLNFLDKDYKTSTQRFEQCLLLKDTSDFTTRYLGYSYFKTENYEQAKVFLERIYQKDTANVELCYALGLSCVYSYYKKAGIEYLNKTIDLLVPSPELLSQVYKDLANAYTGFYKYDEALVAYNKALELTPNDALLIYEIASHYDKWMNNREMALKYYQNFMATQPKDKKSIPTIPLPGGVVVSHYDYVEKRIAEIRKELSGQSKKLLK